MQNTTKTKTFTEAIDEMIVELKALKLIEDGWAGGKKLDAEIESIQYGMAYLPEYFREGDEVEEED